jgi:diguanylate cyclase (GGDEF)-like protein
VSRLWNYNHLDSGANFARRFGFTMISVLQNLLACPADPAAEKHLVEIQEQLRALERRDWWLWSLAVAVMLLLTFAVFSMSFPPLAKVDDPFFQSSLERAVRGLVILVLLFNAHTIYQQVTIKRLRRQLSQQLDEMQSLHIRAEEFHRLAVVDPLTGLYNRRFAEKQLSVEASRSHQYGHGLTVLALDLNDFKQVNDAYGHAAGDQVLKQFAARLQSVTRRSDCAARMGGDEFLLLLPECPARQVEALLARLRPVEVEYAGRKIPVSFSAGWVAYEQGETTEQFLERADHTLYAEKRAGKTLALQVAPVT